jgi:hypothetical protein
MADESKERLENLTPDQEAAVGRIIDQWISENVETKLDEHGVRLFRLRPPGTEQ